MKRIISRMGLAAVLGAVLSLAAGPSPAAVFLGKQVTETLPPLPLLPAQYSPSVLDLGTLRAYRNEQHTATLTITAPDDGAVVAQVWPLGSPIQITQISRFAPRSPGGLRTRPSWPLETVGPGGTVHATAGDRIVVEVALQSARNQPETLNAEVDAGSKYWYIEVPIKAFVVQQPEIVPAVDGGEYKIVPGGQAEVKVHLNRTRTQSFTGPSGVDQEVTITARSAPAGISVDPVTVRVPADALTVDAPVTLHANANTAMGAGQTTTLAFAYGGESHTLDLEANVYPTQVTWYPRLQVGDVVSTSTITLRSDGTWIWRAHLHDEGVIFGDLYSIAFWVNTPTVPGTMDLGYTPEGGYAPPAAWANGSLGGGVSGGSTDGDIEFSSDKPQYGPPGPNLWLRKHYIEAVDDGYVLDGNSSLDGTPAMKSVFGKLVEVFAASG